MTETRLQSPAYRRPISTWWWLKKRSYFVFAMRELSSIFIAWFVVFLLVMVYAIGRGEDQYQSFLDWASSPWVIVINVVALLFVLLHTITWFNLTPQAIVVHVGHRRLPAWLVVISQYVALVVVSAFVFWLVAG
jgi:fumarate reductase subunit C